MQASQEIGKEFPDQHHLQGIFQRLLCIDLLLLSLACPILCLILLVKEASIKCSKQLSLCPCYRKRLMRNLYLLVILKAVLEYMDTLVSHKDIRGAFLFWKESKKAFGWVKHDILIKILNALNELIHISILSNEETLSYWTFSPHFLQSWERLFE